MAFDEQHAKALRELTAAKARIAELEAAASRKAMADQQHACMEKLSGNRALDVLRSAMKKAGVGGLLRPAIVQYFCEKWTQAVEAARDVPDTRACICYPDETRPAECQRKFALRECRAAAGLPDLFPPGGNAGVASAQAHSKSEYKRRVAQGDPNVLPAAHGVRVPENDQRQVREDSQGLGEPGRLSPDTELLLAEAHDTLNAAKYAERDRDSWDEELHERVRAVQKRIRVALGLEAPDGVAPSQKCQHEWGRDKEHPRHFLCRKCGTARDGRLGSPCGMEEPKNG